MNLGKTLISDARLAVLAARDAAVVVDLQEHRARLYLQILVFLRLGGALRFSGRDACE